MWWVRREWREAAADLGASIGGSVLAVRYFTFCEQAVFAVSLLAIGFLLIDPFMYERAQTLSSSARNFFRFATDLGKSNWMLIPTASIVIFAAVMRRQHLGLRNRAGYEMMIASAGYAFVAIAGAGLIALLLKGILGRARPKLFEEYGHFEFQFFAFDSDFLSIPSGHATTIFAFATVVGIFWPRARFLLYTLAAWIALSRVLVGVHYFTDIVLGAILGTVFPYVVRDRFAARRWLFEYAPGGGYRLRAPRFLSWLNWPESVRRSQDAASRNGAGTVRQGLTAVVRLHRA